MALIPAKRIGKGSHLITNHHISQCTIFVAINQFETIISHQSFASSGIQTMSLNQLVFHSYIFAHIKTFESQTRNFLSFENQFMSSFAITSRNQQDWVRHRHNLTRKYLSSDPHAYWTG